ncbi:hypothetical protein TREMEDRAFT_30281 [Tremella mesenterica DSM 1558]|uniref:uncharacterized protein n=1 Tax=Tremella mesenterica (strain ATCC 24925 / CBS 8224 / DSM 1558 / NBRC 9311 / NRRL Y-6157 / RJB 2259-6 / UBC 559-6) TaxID=578456 RepID=UPI0003F4A560|nr:uncharacterized protein TREMEDRAFT_30281 [Tremella mesenterica DSM 1558]EIW70203.1 hypothetical protein TREMEDRAFT_30281 [Tremella mesenterica DSM 1558]
MPNNVPPSRSSRFIVPPMPPRIHRRLRLVAREDGLVITPSDPESHDGVMIRWGVESKLQPIEEHLDQGLEIGGILGLVRLWDTAYLLVFLPPTKPPSPLFSSHSDSEETKDALSGSRQVYTIENIHPVPLSYDLASKVIQRLTDFQTKKKKKTQGLNIRWKLPTITGPGAVPSADPSDPPDESEDNSETSDEEDEPRASTSENEEEKFVSDIQGQSTLADPPKRHDLETKIIRQICREFSSGSFFYSFDLDLTHSLQHKRTILITRANSSTALSQLLPEDHTNILKDHSSTTFEDVVEPDIRLPLWRRVDRRFFWNEHLLKDFLDAGLNSFILPVMQGWVQSTTFNIPIPPNPRNPEASTIVPVDLTVISRRSRDRAGLRYQRRGIDEEGHVANFVETEMMVRAKIEGKVSVFSFIQIRGSIPLKWSQSPYSMKPPPVLDQPVEKCYSVANSHFDDLTKRYGPITIVNLSEQVGKEAVVTNGYRQLVRSLERIDIKYEEFDFHAKCKGMKWENIAELVTKLDLSDMGYLWTLQGEVVRRQDGVFRTNCIDCLDRTNVVQSAIARQVLGTMLIQLGFKADLDPEVENVFNDVWANNGDTISLCYAHTSALKGDFVRTGKRDLTGMLHDGVSSLSRMFYGAISDFFAQAVISFFLGHRNLGIFSEFLETMQSTDASNLVQLSRIRTAAIEIASARVLSEGEIRLAGWTLLSPEERNVRIGTKLEEKILILTRKAVYVVVFNFALEKVVQFTRIPLGSITLIQLEGAYILSPLQEASRDPLENYGFVLNFSPSNEDTRYNTYSIRNRRGPGPDSSPSTPLLEDKSLDSNQSFAFKVLPREFIAKGASSGQIDEDDISIDSGDTCKAAAERIVEKVKLQCEQLGGGGKGFVKYEDIVSLEEAQRSTTLLERVDYALKRFLWL